MDSIIANILRKQGIEDLLPISITNNGSFVRSLYNGDLYGYVKDNTFHICNAELEDVSREDMGVESGCLCIEKTEEEDDDNAEYLIHFDDCADGYLIIIDETNKIISKGNLIMIHVSSFFWFYGNKELCAHCVKPAIGYTFIQSNEINFDSQLPLENHSLVSVDDFLKDKIFYETIIDGLQDKEYSFIGKISKDRNVFVKRSNHHKIIIKSDYASSDLELSCDYLLVGNQHDIFFISLFMDIDERKNNLVVRFQNLQDKIIDVSTEPGKIIQEEFFHDDSIISFTTSINNREEKNLHIIDKKSYTLTSIRISQKYTSIRKEKDLIVLQKDSDHFYIYNLNGNLIGTTNSEAGYFIEENKDNKAFQGLKNVVSNEYIVPPVFSAIKYYEQIDAEGKNHVCSIVSLKYFWNDLTRDIEDSVFGIRGVFYDSKLIVPIGNQIIKAFDNRWLLIKEKDGDGKVFDMKSNDFLYDDVVSMPSISYYRGKSYRCIRTKDNAYLYEDDNLIFSDCISVKALDCSNYPALYQVALSNSDYIKNRNEELSNRWLLIETSPDCYNLYDLETNSIFCSDFSKMVSLNNDAILFYDKENQFTIYNSIRNEFTEKFDFYERMDRDTWMLDGKHSMLCLYNLYRGWILKDELINEIQKDNEIVSEKDIEDKDSLFFVRFSDDKIAYFSSKRGYLVPPRKLYSIQEFEYGYLINDDTIFDLDGDILYEGEKITSFSANNLTKTNSRYKIFRNSQEFIIIYDGRDSISVYHGLEIYKEKIELAIPADIKPLLTIDYVNKEGEKCSIDGKNYSILVDGPRILISDISKKICIYMSQHSDVYKEIISNRYCRCFGIDNIKIFNPYEWSVSIHGKEYTAYSKKSIDKPYEYTEVKDYLWGND